MRALQDATWFAYFTPYPLPRHQALVAATQLKPNVRLEVLGPTLDGRDVDLLTIGEAAFRISICTLSLRSMLMPGTSAVRLPALHRLGRLGCILHIYLRTSFRACLQAACWCLAHVQCDYDTKHYWSLNYILQQSMFKRTEHKKVLYARRGISPACCVCYKDNAMNRV